MRNFYKIFTICIFFILLPIKLSGNIVDELTKLNNLYKEGAITKEEFKKAKNLLFKSQNENSEINDNDKFDSEKTNNVSEDKTLDKFENDNNKITEKENNKINDLSNSYASLKDVEEFGSFYRINYSPLGLFDEKKFKSFASKAKRSLSDMYLIFVQQKYLMEKNPENVMKAMGYFEFFYMDQLRQKKKNIEKFKETYPNTPKYIKKDIKTIYSLNKARKKMREAMGLTLEDKVEVALDRYMTMHNVLSSAQKRTNNLTTKEKKIRKLHNRLKANISSLRNTIELRKEKRIKEKEFARLTKKDLRLINVSLNILSKDENDNSNFYKVIKSFYQNPTNTLEKCIPNCTPRELLLSDDNLNVLNTFLKDAEKKLVKKKYELDMSNVSIEKLSSEQTKILKDVSFSMKENKVKKRNLLQNSILNLDNNGVQIDKYLNNLNINDFNISSIDMTYDTLDNMKLWAMKDWSESWKGSLPEEIKDTDGNIIEFTEDNLEDIKAQLAINSFSQMIESSNLKDTVNDSIKDIAETINKSGGFNLDSFLSQDFSITLNNYSKLVGNSIGVDMSNFNDLTNWANEIEGTNVSSADYAKAWESAQYFDSANTWGDITRGVDLLDTVGSFEAASIAKQLGQDLQTVADTISQAASVGVSTDLEAAATGLGYGSFADAVRAYNEKYGTNYTEAEAREALGN